MTACTSTATRSPPASGTTTASPPAPTGRQSHCPAAPWETPPSRPAPAPRSSSRPAAAPLSPEPGISACSSAAPLSGSPRSHAHREATHTAPEGSRLLPCAGRASPQSDPQKAPPCSSGSTGRPPPQPPYASRGSGPCPPSPPAAAQLRSWIVPSASKMTSSSSPQHQAGPSSPPGSSPSRQPIRPRRHLVNLGVALRLQ